MSRPIPRISITLPNGASAAVGSAATTPLGTNKGVYQGTIALIKVVTPNFTNAITTTIRIYDANGILKYQTAALAENSGAAGYCIPVSIPIYAGEYVVAAPSDDPGAGGGIVTIDLEFVPDVVRP